MPVAELNNFTSEVNTILTFSDKVTSYDHERIDVWKVELNLFLYILVRALLG